MLNINPSLIGRKYYTSDPKTVYTIQGVYINGNPIVIGELPSSAPFGPNPTAPISILVTHKLADVHLLP